MFGVYFYWPQENGSLAAWQLINVKDAGTTIKEVADKDDAISWAESMY
jgi:hypothetical protein